MYGAGPRITRDEPREPIHHGMETASPQSAPQVLATFTDWMVVNKPAGWHSVQQEGSEGSSVEAWLRANEPRAAALEEAGLCHRLDLWTSGCLAVALTPEAHERLRHAFSQAGSGVRKIYLALAGKGLSNDGRFRLHFESRYKRSAKVSVDESGSAWSAGRCIWHVQRRGPGGHDLVQVELIGPGRRHQIRAGLAHLGHPLAGDTLYGGAPLATLSGPALHAWKLTVDGVEVESALPPAFA